MGGGGEGGGWGEGGMEENVDCDKSLSIFKDSINDSIANNQHDRLIS